MRIEDVFIVAALITANDGRAEIINYEEVEDAFTLLNKEELRGSTIITVPARNMLRYCDTPEGMFNHQYQNGFQLSNEDVAQIFQGAGEDTAILFVFDEEMVLYLENEIRNRGPENFDLSLAPHRIAGSKFRRSVTFSGVSSYQKGGQTEEDVRKRVIHSYQMQLFLDKNLPFIIKESIPYYWRHVLRSINEQAEFIAQAYLHKINMFDIARNHLDTISDYKELLTPTMPGEKEKMIGDYFVEMTGVQYDLFSDVVLADLVDGEYQIVVRAAVESLYCSLGRKGVKLLPDEMVTVDEDFGVNLENIRLNDKTAPAIRAILDLSLVMVEEQDELMQRFL